MHQKTITQINTKEIMKTIEEIKQEAINKIVKRNSINEHLLLEEVNNEDATFNMVETFIDQQTRNLVIEILKHSETVGMICGLANSNYVFFLKIIDECLISLNNQIELVKSLNNIKEIIKLDEKNYEYFRKIFWETFIGCNFWINPKNCLKYDCGGYDDDDEY